MPKITFLTVSGAKTVQLEAGGSLMEAAREHGIDGIDGDCGGVCSCATCHVWVDGKWTERVGEAGEAERDVLEFEASANTRSRLSCQIEVSEALDGLVVEVPPRGDLP